MTTTDESGARLEATKAVWSVVAVYEDAAGRERAVGFCDQLISQFWTQVEFDVGWWSFASLQDTGSAKEAAAKAMLADLIVFSSTSEGDFSGNVRAWTETWLAQRGDREGKLVGLLEPFADASTREEQKHHYLRTTAHRAAMDYLTQVPPDISLSIPDSLDSYRQRANQVTNLLDDILRQQPPPPSPLV